MIIIIFLASLAIIRTYADDSDTFGVRLIPNALIENSIAVLEIFPLHDNHVFPSKIENLGFSSTNSSVVEVLSLEKNQTSFMTHIMIRANSPGTAEIVLAAPGFVSKEIPITVYDDKTTPTNLVIKASPTLFSSNGPKTGHFAIEITNRDGFPVIARGDIPITLATTDSKTLSLGAYQLTIKGGQYYTTGEFTINQHGSAKILASAPSFQSVSTTITSQSATSPIVQAYVYPEKINDFASSVAYVVAVLKDGTGNPVQASNDIPISVTITNATTTGLVNTSSQDQLFGPITPIVIKKGDYVGYSTVEVQAGLNGTFNVRLSAPNGYAVSNTNSTGGLIQLKTVTTQLLDDKSAKLDLLPILATGNRELVGIMHLEDGTANPIIAKKDLKIEVDSSEPNYLTIDRVNMSKGVGVAPVFGSVGGTNTPSPLSLHVITYNDTTLTTTINATSTNSLKLVAESLVPEIMSHSSIPISLYLTNPTGEAMYFPSDCMPTILPNDYISVEIKKISDGDSPDLFYANALKSGTANINIVACNYPTSILLKSLGSVPARTGLDYPTPMFVNSSNFVGLQVFDSNSNPMYPDKDTDMQLISSNDSILQIPDNITISKGSYYSYFNVIPKSAGNITISVLGDNLPLSTYKVDVRNMVPTATINSSASALPDETFLATLKVEKDGKPLPNMNVDWKITGANIQSSDTKTNKDGIAVIALTPRSSGEVRITPTITGMKFEPITVRDTIPINSTQMGGNGSNSASSGGTGIKSFRLNGIDPLPIFVVGFIAIGGFLVRKKELKIFKKTAPKQTT